MYAKYASSVLFEFWTKAVRKGGAGEWVGCTLYSAQKNLLKISIHY